MGATQVLRDILPAKMRRKSRAKPRIFISYRRDDCSWFVTALHNKLSNKFGREKVFQDYDHIEAGEDFAECIHDSVRGCNVFLVVIGKQWLTASRDGERRLDDPKDFVRLEIAAALKRRRWSKIRGELRVIPVLVDGAELPSADDLPEDLADLVNYQAQRIDTSEFEVLSDALIERIRPWVYPWRRNFRKMIKPAFLGLSLVLFGTLIWNFDAVTWWNIRQAEQATNNRNYERAESIYLKLLASSEADDKRLGIENSLAVIYERLGYPDNALTAYDNYLETYKQVYADNERLIIIETNHILQQKGNVASVLLKDDLGAKEYLEDALKLVDGSLAAGHRQIALTRKVLARVYVKLKMYEQAANQFEKSWDAFDELDEAGEAVKVAVGIAEMYEHNNQYTEANIWWKKGSESAMDFVQTYTQTKSV